jgi:hypothetical protein
MFDTLDMGTATFVDLKIAPVQSAAKFRLVPYSGWAQGNGHWLFDTDFRISDANADQFDQPAPRTPDHFYTTDPNGEGAVARSWQAIL